MAKNNKKKTTEEFKKEVESIDSNYTIISEYKRNIEKIEFLYKPLNKTFWMTPAHFLSGERAPFLSTNKKRTDSQFKDEVYNLVKNEYIFLEPYKTTHEKLLVEHTKCKNTYYVSPNKFFQGRRCPFCSGVKKKTQEDFVNEIYGLVQDEYVVLNNYTGCRKKVLFKHNKCSKEFYATPNDFISSGSRCPYCRESKAERYISDFLANKNIDFERQKKFPNCKNKFSLPFDFYLPKLNIIIEYDGEHHFMDNCFTKKLEVSERIYKRTVEHDKIKNEFCKENNIKLFRIAYYENLNEKLNEISQYF